MQEEKDKAITIKTFVYAISLMLCIGFSFGFGIKIADKLYLGEIFYWVLLNFDNYYWVNSLYNNKNRSWLI